MTPQSLPRPPNTCGQGERLGRYVVDRKSATKAARGTALHRRFLLSLGGVEISVDRLDHTELTVMVAIAEATASREWSKTFYGWLVVRVRDAERDGRRVEPRPLEENPYHAIIDLGGDETMALDVRRRHANELAAKSRWLAAPTAPITT